MTLTFRVLPVRLSEHFFDYSVVVLVFKRCYGSVCYDEGLTLETSAYFSLYGGKLPLIDLLDINF